MEAILLSPLCKRCSVSALCGISSAAVIFAWLQNKRLFHLMCPVCKRHGVFCTRTGTIVFPAPENCPIILMGPAVVKLCLMCYRGWRVHCEASLEPNFREKKDGKEVGQ